MRTIRLLTAHTTPVGLPIPTTHVIGAYHLHHRPQTHQAQLVCAFANAFSNFRPKSCSLIAHQATPSPLAIQPGMAFLAAAHFRDYAWNADNDPKPTLPTASPSTFQSLPSPARPKVSSNIAHLVNSTDEDDRFEVGNEPIFDNSSHNGPPVNMRMGTPSVEKTPSDVFMAWRSLSAVKDGKASNGRSEWMDRDGERVYPGGGKYGFTGTLRRSEDTDRRTIDRDSNWYNNETRKGHLHMDRRTMDRDVMTSPSHLGSAGTQVDGLSVETRDRTGGARNTASSMDMDHRMMERYPLDSTRSPFDHRKNGRIHMDRPFIETRDHTGYGTDTRNAALNSSSMNSQSSSSSYAPTPSLRTDRTDRPSWDVDAKSSDVFHAWRSAHSDTQKLGPSPSPSSYSPSHASLSPTMSASSQPTTANRRSSSRQPDASKSIHLNLLEINEEANGTSPASEVQPHRNKRGSEDGEGLFGVSNVDRRSYDASDYLSNDVQKNKRFCAPKCDDDSIQRTNSSDTSSHPLDSTQASTESMIDPYDPVRDTFVQSTFNPHFAAPGDRFRMGVDTPTDKYWDFPYLAHSSDIRRFVLQQQRQEQQQQQQQQQEQLQPPAATTPETPKSPQPARHKNHGRKLAYLRAIRPSVLPTAIGMATAAMNANMNNACDVCGKVFKHPGLLSTHRAKHFDAEPSSMSSLDASSPDSGVAVSSVVTISDGTTELFPMHKTPAVHHKAGLSAATSSPRRTSINKPTISPSPLRTQLVAKTPGWDSSGSEGEGSGGGGEGAVKNVGSDDDEDDSELMFSMVMMMS
ncbi:hypothetical protein BJ742DRAFT_835292 [Cladochytrium replicatum]|nr:hypothetical protein BJ742DRAFT_835292 [Cladochytrium replicatum]